MDLLVSVTFIIVGTIWIGFLVAALFGKIFHSLLKRPGSWPANGVEAEAILLKAETTGTLVGQQPLVRLQMQVKPGKGRNFVAELETVSPPAVKTGGVIRVKYNPRNFKELLLLPVT